MLGLEQHARRAEDRLQDVGEEVQHARVWPLQESRVTYGVICGRAQTVVIHNVICGRSRRAANQAVIRT